jgi:hypothetical protein
MSRSGSVHHERAARLQMSPTQEVALHPYFRAIVDCPSRCRTRGRRFQKRFLCFGPVRSAAGALG